jgi:murein DD-endopeptidase MepM/ murein hydrolase activator NlpD
MAQTHFGQRTFYDESPPRGRAVPRVRTIAAIIAIVTLSLWAGSATLYVLFRDGALRLLAERQAAMANAYDAQVMALKTEIDRLQSIKLIDQERVERALADLLKRQAILEERESALMQLPAAAQLRREFTPEITGAIRRGDPLVSPQATPKPTPLSDTLWLAPPPERAARLESRPAAPIALALMPPRAEDRLSTRIVSLARGIDAFARRQSEALNRVEEEFDARAHRMRLVLAELAQPLPANAPVKTKTVAMGGPFQLFARASDDPFERQLARIRATGEGNEELARALERVPVMKPLAGGAEVTSGYGVRVDPFIKQLALHTGVDLRGEHGDPVKAAGAGRIAQAGYNGGYGLMVEIEHGNGLNTRYAHLSAVTVSEGQKVKAGELIGRIGTTGRSTGPHLHYEVRINGEAVDPQRYLRAGLRLDAL